MTLRRGTHRRTVAERTTACRINDQLEREYGEFGEQRAVMRPRLRTFR